MNTTQNLLYRKNLDLAEKVKSIKTCNPLFVNILNTIQTHKQKQCNCNHG